MLTRSLDINHDWNFGKGKQDYLSEELALPQNIKTRLLSFVNDCFFDLDAGIDWFFYLGSKDIVGLRSKIVSQIAQTIGVTEVKEVNFKLDDGRQLLVNYQVTTAWGQTVTGSANLG